MSNENVITSIWTEDPGSLAYSSKETYCYGYPVAQDLMNGISYSSMIYLLFKGELPSEEQHKLINALLIGLSNPGPRDPSIHAAMAAGVGGSTAASALIAALAVGAGQVQGARELFWCMTVMAQTSLTSAQTLVDALGGIEYPDDTFPVDAQCIPGIHPYNQVTEEFHQEMLGQLCKADRSAPTLAWLAANRLEIESRCQRGISLMLIAAAALQDLGLSPVQGEMFTLLARLPGAAVHSVEQLKAGYKNFPFYPITFENDPAAKKGASE